MLGTRDSGDPEGDHDMMDGGGHPYGQLAAAYGLDHIMQHQQHPQHMLPHALYPNPYLMGASAYGEMPPGSGPPSASRGGRSKQGEYAAAAAAAHHHQQEAAFMYAAAAAAFQHHQPYGGYQHMHAMHGSHPMSHYMQPAAVYRGPLDRNGNPMIMEDTSEDEEEDPEAAGAERDDTGVADGEDQSFIAQRWKEMARMPQQQLRMAGGKGAMDDMLTALQQAHNLGTHDGGDSTVGDAGGTSEPTKQQPRKTGSGVMSSR